jgi:hypothetical protein
MATTGFSRRSGGGPLMFRTADFAILNPRAGAFPAPGKRAAIPGKISSK